jgi:hypothetical protein
MDTVAGACARAAVGERQVAAVHGVRQVSGRWLVRLYPRAWRERYGAEMSAMLEEVPLTLASILDLVAGAIDARLAPHPIPGAQAASATDKENAMLTNLIRRCALGPDVSPQDRWLGSVVMLGLSLMFAVAYVLAAHRYRGNDLVDALGIMAFPAAMLLAMPFTNLKGHSRTSQAIIVGGLIALLAGAAYLAARI